MRIPCISILFILIFFQFTVYAQKALPFRGSFMMSFSESSPGQKILWPFECTTDVVKIGLEVKDVMNAKGVHRRILYNMADSTWLMLMSYNKVKQGTRIKAAAMFRDTMQSPSVKIKAVREEKIIEGYTCKKIIAESKSDSAILWVTADINFDVCRLYKMLAHCGMMSGSLDEGTWYYAKKLKGMVLEVTSINRKTKESYSMNISSFKPNEVQYDFFDLEGYKISNIPEGQSCGPMARDEKE
jgi:hypothetical protein